MRIRIFGPSTPLARMDLAHADFRQQLSELLGRRVQTVRKTDENPARISVIDVAVLVLGKKANYASQAIRILCQAHPAVQDKIVNCKFPGERQRKTPATDVNGIVAGGVQKTHIQATPRSAR